MVVSGGAALGRAITFLATPIITRLFLPEHYGQAAIFISVVVILGSVSTLGYEVAIVIAESAKEATQLVLLSMVVLITFCILLEIMAVIGSVYDVALPWSMALEGWEFFLPWAILISGIEKVQRRFALRNELFSAVAQSEVGKAITMSGTRIVAGLTFVSSMTSLLCGYFAGLLASIMLVWARLRTNEPICLELPNKLLPLAKKYHDFPLYNTPVSLLSTASEYLPLLMLGWIFEPYVVGFYAITNRVLRTPIIIVGRSVQQVFMVKASEVSKKNGSLVGPLTKITLGLSIIGLPVFAILFAFGEEIFIVFLGDKWAESGRYAEILVPLMYSTFITTPSMTVFTVLRRQNYILWIQFLRTVLLIAIFIIAMLMGVSADLVLIAYSVLNIVINTIVMVSGFALSHRICNV